MVGTGNWGIRGAKVDAANLRAEEPRPAVSHHREGAEAMHVIERSSHQSAIDLRFPKLDGKVERSIQDGVEIVCTSRELPEIFRLDAEFGAKLLFDSDVELIAPGRKERLNARCP